VKNCFLRLALALVVVVGSVVAENTHFGAVETFVKSEMDRQHIPGLALLVATLNAASPAISATVLAYLVIAALTLIPYVIWRQRAAARAPDGG